MSTAGRAPAPSGLLAGSAGGSGRSSFRAGRVDAHQHFWDLAAHAQPWLELPGHEPLLRNFSEADLRPLAGSAGVAATVVVQTVTDAGETPELLTIAAASDLVTGVVGWTDLEAPQVGDALAELRERPGGNLLCGIRHPVLVESDPDWLRRPSVRAGLAAVAAAGLCYDIVVPADLLPAATEAARACPGLSFVLDHLGNPQITQRPDETWMSDVRAMAALPNTVCKLSGILGEPGPHGWNSAGGRSVGHLVPYYETALGAFGPDRMMFGSDWPVCRLSASYQQVVDAAMELTSGLSPTERTAIFGGTARRVYGLG
jgi:L-fuconolactonase